MYMAHSLGSHAGIYRDILCSSPHALLALLLAAYAWVELGGALVVIVLGHPVWRRVPLLCR